MAVSTDLNKHIYVGNGTNKTWSVGFRLLQAADLKLYLTDTTTSVITEITTNYSISPTGDDYPCDTAVVTYPTSGDAISSTYKLTLAREVDITQTTVYPTNGDLKPRVIGNDLDKGVMIDQQLNETLARCIKTPISDTGTLDTDEYLTQVLTAAAAAGTSETNAAISETNAANYAAEYPAVNLESTGYGIISGGAVTAQSTPNMTVPISACVLHNPAGKRYPLSAVTSQAINTADATNPRIDLIYISSAGVITYLAGTAAASPVAPTLPTGGSGLANIAVAAGATAITNNNITDIRYPKKRYQNVLVGNAIDFGADYTGTTDSTNAIKLALAYSAIVFLPPGTYLVSSKIALEFNKKIYGAGIATKILINTDISLFGLDGKTQISNISIEYTVATTGNAFEISNATLTDAAKNDLGIIINNINIDYVNDIATPQGSIFWIWCARYDEDGTNWPRAYGGFWNIHVSDIRVTGNIGYFCRAYSYHGGGDTEAWITGLSFDNIVADSAVYGFFGSKSVSTMTDTNYSGPSEVSVNRFQHQNNNGNSKTAFFFTSTGWHIKNSMAWDWTDSPSSTAKAFMVRDDLVASEGQIEIDNLYAFTGEEIGRIGVISSSTLSVAYQRAIIQKIFKFNYGIAGGQLRQPYATSNLIFGDSANYSLTGSDTYPYYLTQDIIISRSYTTFDVAGVFYAGMSGDGFFHLNLKGTFTRSDDTVTMSSLYLYTDNYSINSRLRFWAKPYKVINSTTVVIRIYCWVFSFFQEGGFINGTTARSGKSTGFNLTKDTSFVSTDLDDATSATLTQLPTAGGQIKFPVTQNASSDANTLDDYEEGTFTPTVYGSSTAGTGTYTLQSGNYTKIGDRVVFDLRLSWTAHTGTGSMRISGLPFTAASNGHTPLFCYASNLTFTGTLTPVVASGAAIIYLYESVSGSAVAECTMDAVATLNISGEYQV